MPRVSPLQNSFIGGEFSPLLVGRVDTERYDTALLKCQNYVPILQGTLLRRPGTKYVADVKTAANKTRLVSFEFSITQAYILEFGNTYIRFYRDNGQIIVGATGSVELTGGASGSVDDITVDSVSIMSGAESFDSDLATTASNVADNINAHTSSPNYTAEASSATITITAVDAGTGPNGFVVSSSTTTITTTDTNMSGGGPYEITSPYGTSDLFQLKFTQSADVLYITHPDYGPRKLSRTGHTSWTLTEIDFLDGPYLDTNTTSTTLTPSGTTGSITLTASSTTGINGGDGFQSTDVGRLVRFKDSGNEWTWLEITGHTSTTVVDADVKGDDLASTSASSDWRLGVWSDTTGFPSAVTFHENRLTFAGVPDFPQRVDMSESNAYEFFAPTQADGTVADSNAISFTMVANQVNVIRWLASNDKGLLVGTVGAEWIVRPATTGGALTPTNVDAKRSTAWGSDNIQSVQLGSATMFVQRDGRKIREVNYFFDADGYRAIDITALAEHITQGGIIEFEVMRTPYPIIWAVRSDGRLLGCTYEREDDVFNAGWHSHPVGGVSDAAGANAKVESIAVISSSTGVRDEVWMIVQRYVDGATVRQVEYLTEFFDDDSIAQEDQFFVDSGLTYDGSETTSITGLDHLEGETVSILADGAVVPDQAVSSGSITLETAATKVHAGLGYNSDGQMLRIEAGSADGTAIGKTRRIHRLAFLFWRTLGWTFGQSFTGLDSIIFRRTSDDLGTPTPLFTGIKSEGVQFDYAFDNTICWRQSEPVNGTLLAVAPQMKTEDRG